MSLKQQLLAELERHRGEDISGQTLAGQLGVSRNAVWKAVNSLRADGFDIISATNRGYRLSENSDVLSEAGIRSLLPEKYAGLPLFISSETDSTNNEAKRLLASGHNGPALVASGSQTAGRGRHGRAFYSPDGTGVYMSLIIQPEASLADMVPATTMAAVAVCQAVEELAGLEPQIKWVNDVFLDGKKICGILTEAAADMETFQAQSLIIGIGINVRTEDFPEELLSVATSLFPGSVTRNHIIAKTASRLLDLTSGLHDRSYMRLYRDRSMVLGKGVTYVKNGETYTATALSIDDDGGLLVRRTDGAEELLQSGEISVRPV